MHGEYWNLDMDPKKNLSMDTTHLDFENDNNKKYMYTPIFNLGLDLVRVLSICPTK